MLKVAPPGTPISSGVTKVNFTVSNGEYEPGHSVEYIEVDGYQIPNIVGLTVKKARALLTENALELGSGTSVVSDEPIGTIVSISISYNDNDEPVVDYCISIGRD